MFTIETMTSRLTYSPITMDKWSFLWQHKWDKKEDNIYRCNVHYAEIERAMEVYERAAKREHPIILEFSPPSPHTV